MPIRHGFCYDFRGDAAAGTRTIIHYHWLAPGFSKLGGQRARYACIYSRAVQTARDYSGTTCIREPDPPRWDPDPLLASLPGPPAAAARSPKNGNYRRICGDSGSGDCLYRDQGAWRWREPQPPKQCGAGMSGVEMTCP